MKFDFYYDLNTTPHPPSLSINSVEIFIIMKGRGQEEKGENVEEDNEEPKHEQGYKVHAWKYPK